MKKILALSLLLAVNSVFADGHQLVEKHCMGCHVIDGRGGDKKAAPPMFSVWHHYRQAHPEKEAFVAAVMAWLAQPEQGRSVMQGAIKKFGVMERLALQEHEARQIAEYLHDHPFELPEWYVQHYNENHGQESHGYTRPEQH